MIIRFLKMYRKDMFRIAGAGCSDKGEQALDYKAAIMTIKEAN